MSERRDAVEFVGLDLGHGETALGRAYGRSMREPEILEYRGERSFVTAVAQTDKGLKIGADAVNLAALGGGQAQVWVKFKDRDLSAGDVEKPTRLFTQELIKGLSKDGKIRGAKQSKFVIGCPSGWDKDTRARYQALFEDAGLKSVRIVPESRAALMTALEQGYLTLDAARASVLIVDIGSSTTDFTYCRDLDAEDVGHNFLGSGLLDTEIFDLNLARQSERAKIEKLIKRFPHYRPIMEYWCRQVKEQFFNGEGAAVEMIKRLPIDGGVLFDIRFDQDDADEVLSRPLEALNGFTWPAAFSFALKETIDNLGGRAPETVLLTGGASRLPLVLPACEKAFPKARIVRGAEPEFAIARGLAWLGRFEHLHASFKLSVAELMGVDGPVHNKAAAASAALGQSLAPVLVDALTEHCIVPAFRDWRRGKIDSLDQVEAALADRVKSWLSSVEAQATLRPIIKGWFAGLQRKIEQDTDPLCRDHGLPAMVLSLDDSQHVSRHLEGLTVAAPRVASLESDTALLGTSLTAIIIGALLAHANLLAPLLTNPIGLVVSGAVGGAGFLFGRKALEGKFRSANVPVIARQVMTDTRIRKAAHKQRGALIEAVTEAWDSAASERFTEELTQTLSTALSERADDRAILFLI
ncbi:Hsp70 family protein [Fretibacter rubidus]|uniref:Hsp70 family protein n=1 Tax=Fretibacter rubidus TaxID=570162 RepID=UPI00352A1C52